MGSSPAGYIGCSLILAVLLLFGGRGKISELMGDFCVGHQSLQEGHVGGRGRQGRAPKPDTGKPIDHQSTQAPQARDPGQGRLKAAPRPRPEVRKYLAASPVANFVQKRH